MSKPATANHYLWNHRNELDQLYKCSMKKSYIVGECTFSSYVVRSTKKSGVKNSTTKYSTIHRRCADGVRRCFYVHHISMLKKHFDEGHVDCWDSAKQHVSHLCHQTQCIDPEHLELMSQDDNNSRTISCIGKAVCSGCKVEIEICPHKPKCLTTVSGLCSKCR